MISNIDILKMDCEGAEYLIIPNLTLTNLKKIKNFRIELHGGGDKRAAIIKHLYDSNFRIVKTKSMIIWFQNKLVN